MSEFVELKLRLPPDVATAARHLTNDGVVCAARVSLLLMQAEDSAGRDDARCYAALLEACVVNDAVQDFLHAREEMRREGSALQDSGSNE
jgi:hypothetical protein